MCMYIYIIYIYTHTHGLDFPIRMYTAWNSVNQVLISGGFLKYGYLQSSSIFRLGFSTICNGKVVWGVPKNREEPPNHISFPKIGLSIICSIVSFGVPPWLWTPPPFLFPSSISRRRKTQGQATEGPVSHRFLEPAPRSLFFQMYGSYGGVPYGW